MERPEYLAKYLFDWELLEVVIGGKSALDSKFFVAPMFTKEQVQNFLKGYGLDPSDPISAAELFGNFQEAIQFIKRYFLKEGNSEGLDFKIPNSIYKITDVSELFLMATEEGDSVTMEDRIWAEVILKVMHTILHVDKDLRSNYFPVIQTQVFDRFYKYIYRDEEQNLFLGIKGEEDKIPLIDFETKSKKSRDSVIIKLLHKAENVAEELFDRIGIRFVTKSKFDSLRAIKYLLEKNIVIPHNIKPSRSVNTLIDMEKFKEKHKTALKAAMRKKLSEEKFVSLIEKEVGECSLREGDGENKNLFMSSNYKSIQFTCRQLIKYKNPFFKEFKKIRELAKAQTEENELAKKILNIDVSLIARDVRFFYPYEVQIVDQTGHENNTVGEASHQEYKKAQINSAMKRVFKNLLEIKKVKI